jgi:hypothetical protein
MAMLGVPQTTNIALMIAARSLITYSLKAEAPSIVDVNVGGEGFNFPELVLDALVYFGSERLDEFMLMGVPVIPLQQIQQVLVFFN